MRANILDQLVEFLVPKSCLPCAEGEGLVDVHDRINWQTTSVPADG